MCASPERSPYKERKKLRREIVWLSTTNYSSYVDNDLAIGRKREPRSRREREREEMKT